MTVEEYLHTHFEGADRDYVEGEVVERNTGELPHARLQGQLIRLLSGLADRLRLEVLPEIRIQVAPARYRVADIAVWRSGVIGERIPTVPPFLIAEILSPEDRLVRLQPKIQEYLAHGVRWVWVIDPDERRAMCYSPDDPGGRWSTSFAPRIPPSIFRWPMSSLRSTASGNELERPHDYVSRNAFVIGYRRSRPKLLRVILTPGGAWRLLYSAV